MGRGDRRLEEKGLARNSQTQKRSPPPAAKASKMERHVEVVGLRFPAPIAQKKVAPEPEQAAMAASPEADLQAALAASIDTNAEERERRCREDAQNKVAALKKLLARRCREDEEKNNPKIEWEDDEAGMKQAMEESSQRDFFTRWLIDAGGYQKLADEIWEQAGGNLDAAVEKYVELIAGSHSATEQRDETQEKKLVALLLQYNLEIHGVAGDNNCLFNALVRQLKILGIHTYDPASLRSACVKWLREHADTPMDYDGQGEAKFVRNATLNDNLPTFDEYLNHMELDGVTWGDHLTLLAAAVILKANIIVFSSLGTVTPIDIPKSWNVDVEITLRLGHYAEFHYVSAEPRLDEKQKLVALQLEELGFPMEDAVGAVKLCQGDFDEALNTLTG